MLSIDEGLKEQLPDEVLEGLELNLQRSGTSISLVRTLTTGFTDAVVAIVKVQNPEKGDSLAIIKTDHSDQTLEPYAHNDAIDCSSKEFSEHHLVTQALDPVILDDGWFVMFQEIAGGGINELKPLSFHSGKASLTPLINKISNSLISEWNPSPKLIKFSVKKFLALHYKNKLSRNGNLTHWAIGEFGQNIIHSSTIMVK